MFLGRVPAPKSFVLVGGSLKKSPELVQVAKVRTLVALRVGLLEGFNLYSQRVFDRAILPPVLNPPPGFIRVEDSTVGQAVRDRFGADDHAVAASRSRDESEAHIQRTAAIGSGIDHDGAHGRAGRASIDDPGQCVDEQQIAQSLPVQGYVESELGDERGRDWIWNTPSDPTGGVHPVHRVGAEGVVADHVTVRAGQPHERLRDAGARGGGRVVLEPGIAFGFAAVESVDVVGCRIQCGGDEREASRHDARTGPVCSRPEPASGSAGAPGCRRSRRRSPRAGSLSGCRR